MQASRLVGHESTFAGLDSTAWTAITAIATAGLLLTAFLAAWFAYRQINSTVAIWREETRAFVIVDFEPNPASPRIIDFVVRNTGRTPAFEVQINWVPTPEQVKPVPGFEFKNARFFREPIPMLAPGREHRLFFESLSRRPQRPDLPGSYTVTVTYLDQHKDKHSEIYLLDLDLREGATSNDILSTHHAATALAEIAKQIKESPIVKGSVSVVTETRTDVERRERAELTAMRAHGDPLARPPMQPPAKRR